MNEPTDREPPKALSPDDVVSLNCPNCNRIHPRMVRSMFRGLEFICEGCGSPIETSSVMAAPTAKLSVINPNIPGEGVTIDITLRSDGAWVFLNEDERSILDTLDHDSDRAVAIIVGSMIEDRLKRAILSRLYRHKTIEDRMFQPSGPLGPFSTKIDMALLLGIVSPEAHRDLGIFKDVRNAFAHNLKVRDLRSQSIKDKTSNLKLVHSYVSERTDTQMAVDLKPEARPVIFVRGAVARKQRARDRYLMTAQLFTIRFSTIDLPSWPLPFI